LNPTRGGQAIVGNIDMRALRKRVDARVRSASAVDTHRPSENALKRMLDLILYGVAMRLTLPSGK
jgi:hypothetical protein